MPRARHRRDRAHVGHFHRHRARRLDPDQPRVRLDQIGDPRADERIVEARADAEVLREPVAQIGVRAVDVVRDQHVVARLDDAEIDVGDRREARRLQQRVRAALDLGEPLRERERGRRRVQPVAPLVVVVPDERAHRREIGEHDRRRARDRRHERTEAVRNDIVGLNDTGLEGALRIGCSHVGRPVRGSIAKDVARVVKFAALGPIQCAPRAPSQRVLSRRYAG